MHNKTPAIMIQGTCSNAGKSLITAGLCRIFSQDGLRPAPFKAQNMALNSFVSADGKELGRAQALQALACGLAPDVRMNPVLLKPSSDTGSQVIIMGKPIGHMRVAEYIAYKEHAFASVMHAYDTLAAESGVMVLEGAGSPAEINLQAHDIVNMRMAHYAKAPVLLVGDIDRGGVFAAFVGTMALLPDADKDRVAGFIINKFRGDASLLSPGFDAINQRTGKPFLGVVPWVANHGLPEEDSVSFKLHVDTHLPPAATEQYVDIVLLDLPHISNATDIDPLRVEADVRVRVVSKPEYLGHPDAIIIPGSKNTRADMHYLWESGMAEGLLRLVPPASPSAHTDAAYTPALPHGPCIVGICGGLQMLGLRVCDPQNIESTSPQDTTTGLALLPLITTLGQDKILRRTYGSHPASGTKVSGYEIHHGQSHIASGMEAHIRAHLHTTTGEALGWEAQSPPTTASTSAAGLATPRVWGTYLHGIFDEDCFRRAFVDELRAHKNLPPVGQPTPYTLEPALNRLAQTLRDTLDMKAIYRLLGLG